MFASSEKENAQPTYTGGIRFAPNLATCDNTDDMAWLDARHRSHVHVENDVKQARTWT